MTLPHELQHAIDAVFHEVSLRQISKHVRSLRERYRGQDAASGCFIQSDEELLGYAGSRFAATYAVVHEVLSRLQEMRPGFQPRTLLDIGAGLGSGAWAAAQRWPSLERIDLLEGDEKMIGLGERILAQASAPALQNARYQQTNLTDAWRPDAHDLVIASYVIREIPVDERPAFLDRAWGATADTLCCIEPSKSPLGYEVIRAVRDHVTNVHQASVLAPCVELAGCPTKKGQWCHFGQRVERSRTHRYLKRGLRPYEDEKFSFVILARAPGPTCARVAFPLRRSNAGILLEVCTGDQLQRILVRKRDKEQYTWARHARWGDCVPAHVAALADEAAPTGIEATDPA